MGDEDCALGFCDGDGFAGGAKEDEAFDAAAGEVEGVFCLGF